MKKYIIICADDFAQNEDISEGILTLMRMKRINATSCLVNSGCWSEMSESLNPFKTSHFIGLHVNLTHGQPLSAMWRKHEGEVFRGLAYLMKRCYLKQINEEVLTAEIQAQLDVFTHHMHVYPDFIDGHQHIQQLPLIQKSLLNAHLKQMGHMNQTDSSTAEDEKNESGDIVYHEASFFRHTYNGWCDYFSLTGFPKKQVLVLLGGASFKRRLIDEGIPTNTSFSGLYHLKQSKHYRRYFRRFLKQTRHGGIIMCHPGNISSDISDPLHAYRSYELDYFLSDVFLTDMEDNAFYLMKKQDALCN